MIEITTTRNKILEYLNEYSKENGVMPSYDEIADAVGISKSTVHFHILKLEQSGRITRKPGASRYISLVAPPH